MQIGSLHNGDIRQATFKEGSLHGLAVQITEINVHVRLWHEGKIVDDFIFDPNTFKDVI